MSETQAEIDQEDDIKLQGIAKETPECREIHRMGEKVYRLHVYVPEMHGLIFKADNRPF